MRICFITTHYPPSQGFGGVCESSHGLATAIARNGVAVDVVTSDSSKDTRIPLKAFSEFEEPNLRIYPFKHLAGRKSCFSFDIKKVLSRVASQSDLVHINGIFTHPVTTGAWFARRQRKPHVVAIRNGLDPWLLKIRRRKKMIGFKFYVKNDLKAASCIHTTAQQEIDACKALGIKGPFAIVPNGIDPTHYKNLPAPEVAENIWPVLRSKTVVLFLSRLSPQKGLDMLIPAWDEIKRLSPNAFLMIAGPDHMGFSNSVSRLSNSSRYPNSILFCGSVYGERKLALYSRADVFVLPSYSENFGNVVAEALACGTPVVTTQATPWDEIEKINCGRWIPVDKKALTDAIVEMISTSDEERKSMGQRGRKFILQNYTWDIAARKMITVYKALLNDYKIPLYPTPWLNDHK